MNESIPVDLARLEAIFSEAVAIAAPAERAAFLDRACRRPPEPSAAVMLTIAGYVMALRRREKRRHACPGPSARAAS